MKQAIESDSGMTEIIARLQFTGVAVSFGAENIPFPKENTL